MSRPEPENQRRMGDDPSSSLHQRARAGDPQALQELAWQTAPLLHTWLRLHSDAWLRARESCSDLTQSVLGECLGGLAGFEFRGMPAFRKWLFQKAEAKLIERRRYWQAQRRDPRREQHVTGDQLCAPFTSASQAAIRNEELAAIEACFEHMSPEHRQIIVASRLLGQSHAEIAAELGKSEGAVRMLLHRALAQLGVLMRARLGAGDQAD